MPAIPIAKPSVYLMVGRRREINPVMYVLALISVGLLLLENVKL